MNTRNRLELSKHSYNYMDYVRFELKHLQSIQNVMVNPSLGHYKFKRGIFITKTATNIATQLAETGKIVANKRVKYEESDKREKHSSKAEREAIQNKYNMGRNSTLVIIGDYKLAADSPMKGHPKSAISQFIRELRRRCNVLVINEHNTTKSCAVCRKKLQIAKPPERFAQCFCINNKQKVWNRDINAAVNIKMLGETLLRNQQRPEEFKPGFKLKRQTRNLRKHPPETFKPTQFAIQSDSESDSDN